jgi:hypothetical protein
MKHTDYSCKIMSVGAKIGEPKNQVDFIVSGYFHTGAIQKSDINYIK